MMLKWHGKSVEMKIEFATEWVGGGGACDVARAFNLLYWSDVREPPSAPLLYWSQPAGG